jgi:hypothetical protein
VGYRSAKNEEHLARNGLRSQTDRKSQRQESKGRAFVENVFAR